MYQNSISVLFKAELGQLSGAHSWAALYDNGIAERLGLQAIIQTIGLVELLEHFIESIQRLNPIVEVASWKRPPRWKGREVTGKLGERQSCRLVYEFCQSRRLVKIRAIRGDRGGSFYQRELVFLICLLLNLPHPHEIDAMPTRDRMGGGVDEQ